MKTTPELLKDISITVSKIHQTVSKEQRASEPDFGKKTGGPQDPSKESDGKKLVNIAQSLSAFKKVDKKTRDNYLTFMDKTLEIAKKGGSKDFKNFSQGVSMLSLSLGRLPTALEKFKGVKEKTVSRFKNFMANILETVNTTADINKFKTLSEGLVNLSQSLPTLYESIQKIGKKGVISRGDRAIGTIKKIYHGIADIGAKRQRSFSRGLNTLYEIGYAIREIERPISKLSWVLGKIGISIVAFAGSLLLVKEMLGAGSVMGGLGILTGVIGYIGVMFFLLGKINKLIEPGINTANKIGVGFLILTGGIIGFVASLFIINAMLGTSKDASGIWQSMAIMGGVIAGIVATFTLLGLAEPLVKKGIGVAQGMGLALGILGLAILGFSIIARMITGMDTKGEGEDKEHGMVTKGLGIMGLVILGLVGAFALLGAPYVSAFVATGAGVSILMSAAIFVLAASVKKLVNVAQDLPGGESVKEHIGDMIYGVVGGFASGIARGLFGTEETTGVWDALKKGIAGAGKFALIMAGIPLLTGISVALTAFAYSLKAFAKLGSMTVIEGTDKDGKPKFGETVDVKKTSENISSSISTFLGTMINLMEDITAKKIVKLNLLARTLTGRKGVLRAAIDFTEVLKTYAEFGKRGEIGYEYQVGDKTVSGAVKIGTVVDNIVNSFGTFINKFLSRMGEGDTLEQFKGGLLGGTKRKFIRLSKALSGDNGIFTPMIQFADVLKTYAQFGENMEVGYKYVDDDGNEKRSSISIHKVTGNILATFSTFLESLFDRLGEGSFVDQFKGGLFGGTKRKIIRMTKALTGKHGLLKGMIQFADLLKTYAGAKPGEIRMSYMDGDKEVTESININDTTRAMIDGISTFINELTDKFSGEFGKGILEKGWDAIVGSDSPMQKLKNISKVLTGKNGILSPIMDFTKMIKDYAKFEKESDKNMKDIASSVVSGVSSFINTLKDKAGKLSSQGSEMEKIQESFEKSGSLITSIKKLHEATSGLDKLSSSMKELGNGIGLMAENLDKLNTDKMDKMADIASAYLQETNSFNKSSERVANKSTKSGTAETYNEPKSPQYQEKERVIEKEGGGPSQTVMSDEQINRIANQIGNAVGEKVAAALQNGQFMFEFDTTKSDGASGKYFFEPD
ncbi:MAG: hypothetical protein ACOC22_00775 [bacterium]